MVIGFVIVTTLIAMPAIAFAPDCRDRELDEIGALLTSKDGALAVSSR
ncbi:hypothetical protein I2W78_01025 [Streptomyces spinoverrucosus]|nr:hypothetical protein [Streptomyces spinoverrucosus]MBG0850474.1 hypothetical protein [Streptomyces spinoverrucosus]